MYNVKLFTTKTLASQSTWNVWSLSTKDFDASTKLIMGSLLGFDLFDRWKPFLSSLSILNNNHNLILVHTNIVRILVNSIINKEKHKSRKYHGWNNSVRFMWKLCFSFSIMFWSGFCLPITRRQVLSHIIIIHVTSNEDGIEIDYISEE